MTDVSLSFTDNTILAYLHTLVATKPGLPHGQPVCVLTGHNVNDSETLVQLAADLGPHIAVLQVAAELINDWTDGTIDQLTYLARKHRFLLWEGSKMMNCTVDFTAQIKDSHVVRNTMRDLIQKKYTKGTVKLATWSGLATCYAPGIAASQAGMDILISSLRDAARDTVAATVKNIQTEISAEQTGSGSSDDGTPEEASTGNVQQIDSWEELAANNLGVSTRKLSTISLTQTITQQTETIDDESKPSADPRLQKLLQSRLVAAAGDGPLPPPLLARGMVYIMPVSENSSFKSEYRRVSIESARQNQDFVCGFLSTEPWFTSGRGNDLVDLDSMDEKGLPLPVNKRSPESTYLEKSHSMALFSLVPPQLGVGVPMEDREDTQSQYAFKLESIIGKAIQLREVNLRKRELERKNTAEKPGLNILHVPIVSLP
ncbi:hypothetical protein N7474_004832 [Penicillium riverlandense]|uniref:uncharacterized protein n=1 Tax=Penicillium riverlandense TaxID=1903569 RepID=UPI002548462B|nr:uncharacterized protein N7474_004832 [Penicillium riverlandense]KAJ5819241.1 hypothetical protein N7474_004832 [Penicillium riverlandense]